MEVEPHLGLDRPCILYDYRPPKRPCPGVRPVTPRLAERFEFYLAGLELGNAFSELTDWQNSSPPWGGPGGKKAAP